MPRGQNNNGGSTALCVQLSSDAGTTWTALKSVSVTSNGQTTYTLGGPGDTVVTRGNPDDGAFIAFWLENGRVTAGMNVNVWDVTEPIQQLIRIRRQVPVASLTDVDTPLELLAA